MYNKWLRIIGFSIIGSCLAIGDDLSWDLVRPGMQGVWKTVVEGTQIESYELEILGTAPNFTGPQEPIILARVLDPGNVLSGPVAGMSGSPVFVDGRLIGAYAYGYPWSKEQAIIGITPIERMKAMMEESGVESGVEGLPKIPLPEYPRVPNAEKAERGEQNEHQMQALPTPLQVSGFSARSLQLFQKNWAELGTEAMLTPSGQAEFAEDYQLEAGSALSAVLMTGDFNVAATGTVTWTEGEDVLAFGHPFLQLGGVDLPFAPARIYTVVRSVRQSFKLSQQGPLMGTLYADRLPGVAGRIGEVPQMANLQIDVLHGESPVRSFSAQLVKHPQLFPVLGAMALVESLTQTMEASPEPSILLKGRLKMKNWDWIEWEEAATGQSAAYALATDYLFRMDGLLQNSFEAVVPEALEFSVEALEGRDFNRLKSFRIDRETIRAHGSVTAIVELETYRGEVQVLRIPFDLPADIIPGAELTLKVMDAFDANRQSGLYRRAWSLEEIERQWRERRSPHYLYISLVQKEAGVKMGENYLAQLPPSVRNSMLSERFQLDRERLSEVVLKEIPVNTGKLFSGSADVPLRWAESPQIW